MIGGQNAGGVLTAVEELDLGWELKCALPAKMKGFSSIECNGKLYIFGGYQNINGTNTLVNGVYEYDPSLNNWTLKSIMPEFKIRFSLAVAYGKIYMFGGRQLNLETSTFLAADSRMYQYDPAKNTWTQVAGMSTGKYYVSAATYNNQIYIAGGVSSSNNVLNTVEVL